MAKAMNFQTPILPSPPFSLDQLETMRLMNLRLIEDNEQYLNKQAQKKHQKKETKTARLLKEIQDKLRRGLKKISEFNARQRAAQIAADAALNGDDRSPREILLDLLRMEKSFLLKSIERQKELLKETKGLSEANARAALQLIQNIGQQRAALRLVPESNQRERESYQKAIFDHQMKLLQRERDQALFKLFIELGGAQQEIFESQLVQCEKVEARMSILRNTPECVALWNEYRDEAEEYQRLRQKKAEEIHQKEQQVREAFKALEIQLISLGWEFESNHPDFSNVFYTPLYNAMATLSAVKGQPVVAENLDLLENPLSKKRQTAVAAS